MGLQNFLMNRLIENSVIGKKIQSGDNVSKKGQFALDATEKNPNIEDTMAEKIANLENETKRLDNSVKKVISLPNGASTGDGQIEDAKVGIEGESYDTLGDAIREQVKTYRDVDVSNTTPTNKAKVWVNTSTNDTESQDILLPQVDDANISEENTWSSKKIDSEIGEVNTRISSFSGISKNTTKLTEDSYVNSNGTFLSGTDSYHRSSDPIHLNAGETIYVGCRATLGVAVVAQRIEYIGQYKYVPLVIADGSSQYLYKAPYDMDIIVSASNSWDGTYYSDSGHTSTVWGLANSTDIKKVDYNDNIIQGAYISSTGEKIVNDDCYFKLADGITLHAGETIYVEYPHSTAIVSGISKNRGSGIYTPILLTSSDTNQLRFTAPDDMVIAISVSYMWNGVYYIIPPTANYDCTDITPSMSMFEKIGVVGDSYASGEIAITDYIDYYNVSWGQIIARMCGNKCTNFSSGGLTTRSWLTAKTGKSLLQSSETQQLYILTLGINDYYHLGESYLGTPEDMTTKADTFYGNYATIIESIKEKAPNAKIIMSTMANTSKIPTKFNNAIITIAKKYGIPCIRQDRDSFFKSSFYSDHMVNGHPVAIVYSGMAKAIKRLIENCMHDNFDYFKDYVG